MTDKKRKTSELTVNSSPSTSTTVVGVDNGETVQIPITEFVTKDENENIGEVVAKEIRISNRGASYSSNRLSQDDDGRLVATGNDGIQLTAGHGGDILMNDGDATIHIQGGEAVEIKSYYGGDDTKIRVYGGEDRGEISITAQNNISMHSEGNLHIGIGDSYGSGINFYDDDSGIEIDTNNLVLGKVSQILASTSKGSSYVSSGEPGQVLTSNGDGAIYWGNASGGGSPMMDVTYAELKALRDGRNLIPGMFYKITDYKCTTTQEGTRAMSHNFYIIVQALSCDTLSEIAKADINTSGNDEYFVDAGAKLSAWELKYCLDNDTTRFAWALDGQAITNIESMYSGDTPLVRQPSFDGKLERAIGEPTEYYYAWGTQSDVDDEDPIDFIYSKNETITNGEIVYSACDVEEQTAEVIEGKGVIYYMKDEHGNECPYDFKNIQFKRYVTTINGYPELDFQSIEEGGTDPTWVYTFCGNSYHIDNDEWSELKDGSLESPYMHQSDEHIYTFCNNSMKPYYMIIDEENEDTTKCGKQYLNNNVFFGYWEEIGSTDPENYPYYYAYACAFIEIGYECRNNTFAYGCRHITIGNKCNDNIFGQCCYNIKFGFHCRRNNINGGNITLEGMNEDNVLYGDSLTLLNFVSMIEHNPDGVYNTIYKGYYTIV